MRKLKVLIVSPEVDPYAKSGQLADVAGSLSRALTDLNLDVFIIMPKYRKPEIEALTMELITSKLEVPLGKKTVKTNVYKSEVEKNTIYFIDNPKYFYRENIYGTSKGDYLDNDERFVFFNRAVLEFLLKTRRKFNIIHCHNWATALIPVFLKTIYSEFNLFKKTATVLTLHNLAYQGEFPPESLFLTGLNWNFLVQNSVFNGKFNFLKAGLLYADILTTGSKRHIEEIEKGEFHFGLREILQERKDSFFGIINGIDYEIWNPEHDRHIEANYSINNLEPKKICKEDLIKEFGLKIKRDDFLIGITSYLTIYKGFELLFNIINELVKMDIGIVALVKGDEKFEKEFMRIHRKYSEKIGVKLAIDTTLTHKVVAGSDILLIPSKYEPCGLNQFYGFRYGTVPVVRATGGLDETVEEFNLENLSGNGFKFKDLRSEELLKTIKRALIYYRKPDIWKKIMRNGMEQDYSWKNSATEYLKIYQLALKKKEGEEWYRK